MNKSELVESVAHATGLTKAAAARAVDCTFEAIQEAMKKGDEVRLVGFGTFAVTHRAATRGRNPRTGEAIEIPASKQPKFRPGKALKDSVRA